MKPQLMLILTLPLLMAYVCDPGRVHTYVLAGQSNMVGNSDQPYLEPQVGEVWRARPEMPLTGVIQEPAIYHGHVFGGNPDGTDRSTMALSFAQNTPWVDLLFGVAVGDTCLETDVVHKNAGRWDPDTGDLYARAFALWQYAGAPKVDEWLWLQGECEAGYWKAQQDLLGETDEWQYQQSYSHYKAALINLADHVWQDYQAPLRAAPINLRECRFANDPPDDPTCSVLQPPSAALMGVHDAVIDAASEDPHILPGPIHDDVYSPNTTGHTWDVIELGRRWAALVVPYDEGQ